MKRLLALLAVIAASALSVSAAGATPHPIKASFNATITGGFGGCCVWEWVFQGRGPVAGLGMASYTGTYFDGHQPGGPLPWPHIRGLFLSLTTQSGDTLDLEARISWYDAASTPPLDWTVYRATGRFTHYSGSGVFTVPQEDFPSLAFSMTGNLAH